MKLNNKGFTLVEVLAVVAIIAIIGGIAIPGVLSVINTGKDASYNIMISNIVTASQSLYEEVEFGGVLYQYDANGKTTTKVTITSDNKLTTSLQTLVSNGFLSGVNGNDSNKQILLDPKTNNNIGSCKIVITKSMDDNGKVSYGVINNDSNSICPSEYKKEVK